MIARDELTFYVDGASHGNPGQAGIGVVVMDSSGAVVAKIGEYIGRATNNVAEYVAIIYAMQEALRRGATRITVRSDSELAINQLRGVYRVRNDELRKYVMLVRHLEKAFAEVRFQKVARVHNAEADRLAGVSIEELAWK